MYIYNLFFSVNLCFFTFSSIFFAVVAFVRCGNFYIRFFLGMGEDEIIHFPVNRNGGVFKPFDQVNFHSNDFLFDEKLSELSENDLELMKEYVKMCHDKLCYFTGQDVILFPPGAVLSAWETHFSHSKCHFPLKNYIIFAFPFLKELLLESSSPLYIFECGCGTGSVLLPLMKQSNPERVTFVGCDVSNTALRFFNEHVVSQPFKVKGNIFLFPFDASGPLENGKEPLMMKRVKVECECNALSNIILRSYKNVPDALFDVCFLVFVLSAFDGIEKMIYCLRSIRRVMKPSGTLCFRDYALPDHNFFRFSKKHSLKNTDLFFKKTDGTTQFFFEKDFLIKLMRFCGFYPSPDDNVEYHCNRIENRKKLIIMDKIFLNGSFRVF